MLFRQTSAGGATNLYGLKVASLDAAAQVKDDLAQSRSHGNFNQTGIIYITGQSKCLGAVIAFRTDRLIPLGTLQNDGRNITIGFYVIQDGGLLEKSVLNRTSAHYPRRRRMRLHPD